MKAKPGTRDGWPGRSAGSSGASDPGSGTRRAGRFSFGGLRDEVPQIRALNGDRHHLGKTIRGACKGGNAGRRDGRERLQSGRCRSRAQATRDSTGRSPIRATVNHVPSSSIVSGSQVSPFHSPSSVAARSPARAIRCQPCRKTARSAECGAVPPRSAAFPARARCRARPGVDEAPAGPASSLRACGPPRRARHSRRSVEPRFIHLFALARP